MRIVVELTQRELDMLREDSQEPRRWAHPDLREALIKLRAALDMARP